MDQPGTCLTADADSEAGKAISADAIAAYLLNMLEGPDADRPEIWDFIVGLGEQAGCLLEALDSGALPPSWHKDLLRVISLAAMGDFAQAEETLSHLLAARSQSPLVNGAMFRVKQLESPEDPKFALSNFVCTTPFRQLDVLESSSHLCCASWLPVSAGNLHTRPWQEVWNSEPAQRVRQAILDGSYHYCNKMACPHVMAGTLSPKQELADSDPWWADIIHENRTQLDRGPAVVNLAYDRTCNLTCPSCRQSIIF